MANNRIPFRQMQQYMTYTVLADAGLFILFLLFAGLGVGWLKVILAILTIGISLLFLGYLFITQELLRPRSLWMSTAAAGILLCVIFALLLNYPSPDPLKDAASAETAFFAIAHWL